MFRQLCSDRTPYGSGWRFACVWAFHAGYFYRCLMAADDNKRPNCVKVCFSDRAFIDLGRMAAREERTVADLVHLIVRRHMYGNFAAAQANDEGTDKDREGP